MRARRAGREDEAYDERRRQQPLAGRHPSSPRSPRPRFSPPPADSRFEHAGVTPANNGQHGDEDAEAAIRRDHRLTDEQKQALLAVFRSYVQANKTPGNA